MKLILDAFLVLLTFGGIFFTLIGLFTFFHLLRSQKSPADNSNRLNKFRLWWYVLTREDLFVDTFPWLRNDEYENFKHRKYRDCVCPQCVGTRSVKQLPTPDGWGTFEVITRRIDNHSLDKEPE